MLFFHFGLLEYQDYIGFVHLDDANGSKVFGTLYFTQTKLSNTVMIHGQISNLPKGNHGFQVLSFGPFENSCLVTGEYLDLNEVDSKIDS